MLATTGRVSLPVMSAPPSLGRGIESTIEQADDPGRRPPFIGRDHRLIAGSGSRHFRTPYAPVFRAPPRQRTEIHRSLIVNLQRVRELDREADGGGAIILNTGVRLRVARGRWEALQAALRIHEV